MIRERERGVVIVYYDRRSSSRVLEERGLVGKDLTKGLSDNRLLYTNIYNSYIIITLE